MDDQLEGKVKDVGESSEAIPVNSAEDLYRLFDLDRNYEEIDA